MTHPVIVLQCDVALLIEALNSLSDIAQHCPEIVQRFLDSMNSSAELVRVDSKSLMAGGANECWVLLQPADCLVEFLLAMGARNGNGV